MEGKYGKEAIHMKRQRTSPLGDLRQRRSKKHMAQALMDLMTERPFQEISVVDICRRAAVHRTTFYAHFQDKNALLRYVLEELKRSFGAERTDEAAPADIRECLFAELRNSLTFIRKNRQLCQSSLSGSGPELRIVEQLVADSLAGRLGALLPDPDQVQPAAWFYAGGVLAVARWWLDSGACVSEEKLVEQVKGLVPEETR